MAGCLPGSKVTFRGTNLLLAYFTSTLFQACLRLLHIYTSQNRIEKYLSTLASGLDWNNKFILGASQCIFLCVVIKSQVKCICNVNPACRPVQGVVQLLEK